MKTSIVRLSPARPGLGFLKSAPKIHTLGAWLRPEPPKRPTQGPATNAAAKILSVLVLTTIGCGSPTAFRKASDGGSNCATVGCSAPPLCSEGCTAPCGCCPCTPGERNGDLLCTDRGCYAPAAAPDAGVLAACSGQNDPQCGQGSSCVVGCPSTGNGGICRVAGREICGCGGVDQPCTTPGLDCLYPSCCDYQGLCLTPAERQAVCSGPMAAKFNCAREVSHPDAGTDAGVGNPDAGTDAGNDAGWIAAPACALPFDPGPCEAIVRVYAFVGGSCVAQIYGGCAGNANRFSTVEECMATCEGRPVPLGCPPDRTAQEICLSADATSGCRTIMACAMRCNPPMAPTCTFPLTDCFRGVCQVFPPD